MNMDRYKQPFELARIKIIKSVYNRIPFEKCWRAVDLGSGRGYFADIIKSHVEEVCCLEGSHEAIEVCRAKGYKVILADLERGLPYQDSEFDFVNALEVIEHLKDPIYFLEEIKRITKPGKFLLLSTLNRISLEGWKGKILERFSGRKWDGWDATHKHLFTYSEFFKMVNSHFEILDIIGFYYGFTIFNRHLPPVIWRYSSSNKILRRFGFYLIFLARNNRV